MAKLFIGKNEIVNSGSSGGTGLTPDQEAKINLLEFGGNGESALFDDGDYKDVATQEELDEIKQSFDDTVVDMTDLTTRVGTLETGVDDINTTLAEKVDKTSIVTELNSANVDTQIPSAKVVYDKLELGVKKSDIVTVLDGTETDEKIPSALVVSTELDEKLNKDVITTTLDETSTDDQVASAKVVYDKLQQVFQSSNDAQDEYEATIIGKGGVVSKVGTVATKSEIVSGIESISVGEDITPIHTAITDLGYSATDLTNLSSDKTAHIISKWFVLKTATDNVDTILDVANTDTLTDWVTDDEITDFGDYINPTYSITQLTASKDTTSGMFVSEELTVDGLHTINERMVD